MEDRTPAMLSVSDKTVINATPTENGGSEWDFIEACIRELDKHTDANRPLKEASGLFIVSSLVPKAIIPLATSSNSFARDRGPKGMKLNEWFLIIGLTGMSRKTSVLNRTKSYLDTILGDSYLAPDIFTPEALIDTLKERSTSPWVMDEFAMILEMTKNKEYMGELTGLLQKLYDGQTIRRRTKTGGEVLVPDPYVTVLLSTSYYAVQNKLITEDMIHHGFLNRMLIIWDDGVENFVPISKRFMSLGWDIDDPDVEKLFNWGRKLYELNSNIILMPNGEVLKKIEEFDVETYKKLKELDEVERAIRARYTIHLLKLAGLYRVSRMTVEELEELRRNPRPVFIEAVDYDRARKFLTIVEESTKRLLEEMGKAQVAKPKLESIEELVETVKRIVLAKGKHISGDDDEIIEVFGSPTLSDIYKVDGTVLCREWARITRTPCSEGLRKVLKELKERGVLICDPKDPNEREKCMEKERRAGRPKEWYYFQL